MSYRCLLWEAIQVRTAVLARHYFLSSCIYFQFRIYKLPSAVGCAHADYLPRENIAVKNSCVRLLSSLRLTPWSLAEWENRVVVLWDEVSIWGNVERVLISTCDITFPPLLALLTEHIWDRRSRRWFNASILCLDWEKKEGLSSRWQQSMYALIIYCKLHVKICECS